jgi:hypothetical protein
LEIPKVTPEQIVNKIAASEELIEFATTPARAFMLISYLQLALRHPQNTGESAEFVRQMITNITMTIATVTQTPEFAGLVAMGFDERFDADTEEELDILYENVDVRSLDFSTVMNCLALHILAARALAHQLEHSRKLSADVILQEAIGQAERDYENLTPKELSQILEASLEQWRSHIVFEEEA